MLKARFYLGVLLFVAIALPADATLGVHPSNPRYFTDGSEKAIYLGGHQSFSDLQDKVGGDSLGEHYAGDLLILDWNWYVPFVRSFNLNYIRNWTEFSLGPSPAGSFPLPFARVSGYGDAKDGQPKVDLYQFNEAFFDRMRSRAIELGNNEIYISYMLFDVYGFADNRGQYGASLFNSVNNINGINADVNGDGWGVEFFSNPTSEIQTIQKNYAKKVVDTIGDLNNVLIEVSNEANNIDWHYDMINFLKSYMVSQGKRVPVMLSPGGLSGVDTFESWNYSSVASSPADTFSVTQNWDSYLTNPPLNNAGKPVFMDMDHIQAMNNDRSIPWKAFTRGYHFALYDHPFENPSKEDGVWRNTRRNIGAVNTYARKMDLASMEPSISTCSTSFCLVKPGSEYLIYQPDSGSFSVSLESGPYSYEWFNPSSGFIANTGTVSALRGSQNFSPPFDGDAVLYLKSEGSAVNP
jgi:hypothetical protein